MMSIAIELYRGWLFLKRGWLTMLSYRTALLLGLFSGLLGIVQFGLMGQFVSHGNSFPLIEQYGGDLLAYLIIGSVFTSFVGVALHSFQGAIRSEQQMGTLEHLLLADLSLTSIMLYSALWNFLQALLNAVIIFVFVLLLFQVSIAINIWVTALVLVLTVLSLSGIGMTSAGIILVTKRGDPVGWIFSTLTGLLSGVLFPIEILPIWLMPLSMILPTTHALKALRMTLVLNASFQNIQSEILFLVVTTLITFPLGLFIFHSGLRRAKRDGSLSEY
jgi:ABC-2 type transport system permease protein